jgi:uncharacterized protein
MQQGSANLSPCNNHCILDSKTHLCHGCQRTMDEIMSWSYSTEEQKKIILERVQTRKNSLQQYTQQTNEENLHH